MHREFPLFSIFLSFTAMCMVETSLILSAIPLDNEFMSHKSRISSWILIQNRAIFYSIEIPMHFRDFSLNRNAIMKINGDFSVSLELS